MEFILIDRRGLYLKDRRQGRASRLAVTLMRDEDGSSVLYYLFCSIFFLQLSLQKSQIRNRSLAEVRFLHLLVFKQGGGLVG